MADKIAKRGISIYIDGKEVKNSVNGIKSELIRLNAEQKKMTIGSDEYIAHAKKIAYLDSLFQEHKANQKAVAAEYKKMGVEADSYAKKSESSISKMANGINKYFAMFTTALAAVTGLTLGLKKFMDMRMEMEDASANLQSLTGLGDKDIAWLRSYAKELSTTTTEAGVKITASAKEIMDGFTTIGSKRPELLKNKEAMAELTKQALTLAATGVPTEEAFNVVTASLNQFNLEAKDGSRVINAIAAGSLAGSAEANNLGESLKNVGTVANDSNMTLEDTVAMLEVLASKQLMSEEAGTKMRGALLKLKEAGVGYQSGVFNLKDALVELNGQLEKKTSAAEKDALKTKVFGAENVTVGTIMLQNVDAYDKMREAVTGTNTAYDQAIVRTKTVSAALAQAKNKFSEMGMELVKNLSPAMLKATDFGNAFLKLLVKIPAYWKENKTEIIAFTSALLAYGVVLNAQLIATKTKLALGSLEKVLDAAKILMLRTRIVLTGEATIAELRLLAAQKALNAAMMKNIWGLVAAAIAMATVYLISFIGKSNELTEAQKIANGVMEDYRNNFAENSRSITQEKAQLNGLVTAIINTNDNQTTRNRLIDELNAKYPGFISFIDKEKVTNTLLAQALADVNDQYDMKLRSVALNSKSQAYEQAAVKAMQRQIEIQTELSEIRSKSKLSQSDYERIKLLQDEDKVLNRNIKSYENSAQLFRANARKNDAAVSEMNTSGYYAKQMAEQKKIIRDVSAQKKEFENLMKTVYQSKGLVFKGLSDVDNAKYNKQIADANAAYNYAKLKYAEIKKLEKSTKSGSNTTTTTTVPTPIGTAPDNNKTKDPYADDLKALEDFWKDDEAIQKNSYATQAISEDNFHQFMFENKINFLKEKLKLQQKYGKDTTDTEIAISEAIISETEYCNNKIKAETEKLQKETNEANKQTEKDLKDHLKRIDSIRSEFGLESIRLTYSEQLKLLKEKLAEEKATEEETARAIADFKRKTAEGYVNDAAVIAQRLSSALNNLVESEQMAVENKYAKQIEAARKAGKDTTELEEKSEEEKKAIKKKYADLEFAITVAGIIAETAAAVMKAAPNVPLQVAEGLLGISQLAIAKKQRDAVANLWTGGYGYTPNVGKYTPTGVIHGGEFVSSMEAVNNPNLRPMLDAIDMAQKNGTVGSLTKSDLAKALNVNSTVDTTAPRTRTATSGYNPNAPDNHIYAAMIARQAEVIEKLNKRLDEPFEAYSVISGKKGSFEQTRKYQKLIKNASR